MHPAVSGAQVLFQKLYGNIQTTAGGTMHQTSDGGYILCGMSKSYLDLFLTKTNANGDTTWTKTYGGPQNEGAADVQQTSDGGYFSWGNTNSFGQGYQFIYLVKTDGNGDTLWTRCVGENGFENDPAALETRSGGYLVAGVVNKWSPNINSDIYLTRINAAGDTLWTRMYGLAANFMGLALAQTYDGGFVISQSFNLNTSNWGIMLMKTDSAGALLWNKTYSLGSGLFGGEFTRRPTLVLYSMVITRMEAIRMLCL
jgi:hypothetical protein